MNVLAFFEFSPAEMLIVALAFPVLAIFCLVDIIRSDFKDSTTKLIWVLVVLLAPFIGSILYLIIGRNSKSKIY
jgi:beta-lactamase regulating signal transducer with metallopeptidase domain